MFNRKIGTISWKIHRPYEGMAIGGGTPTYTKEVTGNGYIDLTDAVVNKLLELKAYGGCSQASTPTPSTPVDIVCNNGTLKVRKESGLPFRYKKVEYITASSTQWLNTGIKLASTDIVEAEYKNSSSSGYGALYGVFSMGDSSAFYANGTYYGYDVSNNKVNTGVDVDTARHTLRHDFVNGVITLDDTTTTFTTFTFDNSKDNYLFSRYYNTSYGYGFKGSCRKYRIYRGGELICDLIPVIDTQNNNEPGMYDLVSGKFKGNVGTGNFTAGAEAQDDIEVYVDGTKEKIGVVSKEYFTTAGADVGYVIGQNFVITANSNYTVTAPIRFDTGTYDVSWSEETGGAKPFTIFPCDSEGNLVGDTPLYYKARSDAGLNTGTFTTNGVLARVSVRKSYTDVTIKREMPTTTATCEDLLGVGDYLDEQEILSGNVVVKNVVMVLDGTENWSQATTSQGVYRYRFEPTYEPKKDGSRGPCVSTHFVDISGVTTQDVGGVFASTTYLYFIPNQDVDTVAKWTTFLANQLSAGTPVIVLYPLATPTTLSVAGQSLSIPAGNSRIEIVEGSILNLPLYAKYKSTTE